MYDWGMTYQTITLMKTEGSSKTEWQLRTYHGLTWKLTQCVKSQKGKTAPTTTGGVKVILKDC